MRSTPSKRRRMAARNRGATVTRPNCHHPSSATRSGRSTPTSISCRLVNPRELASAMDARFDDYVEALGELVNIDSGTFTTGGVNLVADWCEARFRSAGWDVTRRNHEPAEDRAQLGDIVIGQIDGGGPGPRVLLVGHTDTVFEKGTASERPFATEGGRGYGPGVCDMKSGLLVGFFAVELLLEAAALQGSVVYVCNPDEEVGSPYSKPIIREAAKHADVALVLEPARSGGRVVTARKGVSDLLIHVTGRSAHAGVEPEKGASAV